MQLIGFYAESAVADLQILNSLNQVHHFALAKGNILSVVEFAGNLRRLKLSS